MKGGFSLFWPPLTTSLQKFDFKQINFIFHFYCNKKWFQYIHLLSIFSQCHESKTGAGKRKILFSKDVGRRVVDNAMTGPSLWKKFLYLSKKKFLYLLKKFLYFSEKKLISSTEKNFFFLSVQPYIFSAPHKTVEKAMYDLIIEKCFFLFYNIFFFAQPEFLFHLQVDSHILHTKIVFFFIFFLR